MQPVGDRRAKRFQRHRFAVDQKSLLGRSGKPRKPAQQLAASGVGRKLIDGHHFRVYFYFLSMNPQILGALLQRATIRSFALIAD